LLALINRLLPLPIKFDANEWFILLSIGLGYSWLLFTPRRYPRSISVLIILFTETFAIILDHALAPPPLDLYDINDTPKYELMDVITYLIYSPFSLLTVYLYDKLNPRGIYFTAYVICWSAFCVAFEWASVKCHVFTFHYWNLVYSFSVYLIMTTLQISFFKFLLSRVKREHIKA
jgi:hypothetical protein